MCVLSATSSSFHSVFCSRGGFLYENPIGMAIQIFTMLTIGWPLYLFTNVTGQTYKKEDGSSHWVSHFHPNRLFRAKYHGQPQNLFVLLSDAGLLVMVFLLVCFSNHFGFGCMVRVYFIPYLVVNFWLVLITELQHSDIKLPHYSGKEWNYLRGALATVDRDYGILNAVFHHIGDTHVCHHLYVIPALASSFRLHSYSIFDLTRFWIGFINSLTTMLKRLLNISSVSLEAII